MGQNKTENLVFSFICCLMMVVGMTIYNVALATGAFWTGVLALGSLSFLAMFAIAFCIDWFIVGPIVKGFVGRFTHEKTPLIKKILLISCLMVLLMCTAMSWVATMAHGHEGSFGQAYQQMFLKNFIFALPLQLLLVGPLARALFLSIFRPAPTVADAEIAG